MYHQLTTAEALADYHQTQSPTARGAFRALEEERRIMHQYGYAHEEQLAREAQDIISGRVDLGGDL